MPVLSASLAVAGLASLGLPATAGFVSEIHVFLGTFPVWSWMTAIGAFGVVLTAGYILWMIQRVMFGPRNSRLDDLTERDAARDGSGRGAYNSDNGGGDIPLDNRGRVLDRRSADSRFSATTR